MTEFENIVIGQSSVPALAVTVVLTLAHIGLTVVAFCGVKNGKKAFLPLAILLHMAMDTFPALYQRGVMPLRSVEIWAAVWVAVIVWIAGKLYKKMKEEAEAAAYGE